MILYALSVLAAILALLFLGSYLIFGTANFLIVARAYKTVASGNAEYIEISGAPNRIVIATADDAYSVMTKALESEGYVIHYDDRMGSVHHIVKDDKSEYVQFSVNEYFAIWKWKT